MCTYQEQLRRITKGSNDLLLDVVEDLSYVYSDGRESRWDPAAIEEGRKQVIRDLLAARDAFVFRHQDILLDALGIEVAPSVGEDPDAPTVSAWPSQ